MSTSTQNLLRAGDLAVGDQLAEGDGFLWDVGAIVKRTKHTIRVRLHSDFSSFRNHWHDGPGVEKTFRKSSMLRGLKKKEDD